MVQRLPVFEQGTDDGIQLFDLLFRKIKAGTGFCSDSFILLLSRKSFIKSFFQSTLTEIIAPITDIRRSEEDSASFLDVIRAKRNTPATKSTVAFFADAVMADITIVKTIRPVKAIIERSVGSSFSFKDDMGPNFL